MIVDEMLNRIGSMLFASCLIAVLTLTQCVTVASSAATQLDDEFVHVDIRGKLTTGIMAIGGETTGTTISAGKITWELDCTGNKEILAALEKLNGKTVHVRGKLELKQGVEIPQRWIVHVEGLSTKPFKKDKQDSKRQGTEKEDSAVLTEDGKLKSALILKLSQGGFAGFSGYLYSISEDGSWTMQQFLNENVREVEAKGQLDTAAKATLAKILHDNGVLKMPEELGVQVGANPSLTLIQFGEFQTQMSLQGGMDDPSQLDKKMAQEKQLLTAVRQIKKMLDANTKK